MDKQFAQYLAEIQKSYTALPKPLRIRIERWSEKLATTGNNPVWKKQRNAYAKLLLNMVVNRHLEAPFNVLPPDGPLAPLDTQQKVVSRNLLGSHETEFWRDLYRRFEGESGDTSHYDGFAFTEEKVDELGGAIRDHTSRKTPIASTASNNLALSREIQSLNMLIREQSQKIRLLEQQLHDERVQHELQLQRLNYSHRVEVNNLKTQLENFAMEMSVEALSPSRKETRSFLRDPVNSPSAFVPAMPRFNGSFDGDGASPRRSFSPPGRASAAARVASTSMHPQSPGKHSMLSFLDQKNSITAALNTMDRFDAQVVDLTPRRRQQDRELPARDTQYRPNPHDASGLDEKRGDMDGADFGDVEQDEVHDTSRFDMSALDASLRWGPAGEQGHHQRAAQDAEDEAFLAHIDRFQSEIKKINTNITMTSPERF